MTENNGYITPMQTAKTLQVPYRAVLHLISCGYIKAEKVKGKWRVTPREVTRFQEKNRRAIKKLQAEYVKLYWQGLNPDQLERHVGDDFSQRGIIANKNGFATLAIYNSLIAEKAAKANPIPSGQEE